MFADFNWAEALQSSPILLVLIASSVITFGIALERALYFKSRRSNPEVALAKIVERVRAGRVDEAKQVCTSVAHPLGAVTARLLDTLTHGKEGSEEQLQVALSEQKLVLEKNIGVLGSMAAIAPLVGLLGTVWGIMRAFHDMSLTGSAAPSVVAAGVAEALLTTAAGLVVAVPAVILYNHFTRRMSVMLTQAENNARQVRVTYFEAEKNPRSTTRSKRGREESGAIDTTLVENLR